jgi:hypothetical protein
MKLSTASRQRTSTIRIAGAVSVVGARTPIKPTGPLAFAHLVIAVAFLGPYCDPVRNKWIITFGLIACTGLIPLALIAGPIRGIPLGWRLIDCSFGVVGSIPLLICRMLIIELEKIEKDSLAGGESFEP